jgi:hypothetical protein
MCFHVLSRSRNALCAPACPFVSHFLLLLSFVVTRARQNPVKAVPIVLARLQQKHVEWMQTRMQMQEQWKETYEDNFYKVRLARQ